MNNDSLTICKKCGSNFCYTQEINEEIKLYSCLGCGFLCNTAMKKGNELFEEQMLNFPNLYKELTLEDEEGNIFFPIFIDKEEGMIFANGKNKEDWKWAVIKKIEIPEKDQKNYPIPGKKDEFYTKKTDMSTLKHFNENDFMEALVYLGVTF